MNIFNKIKGILTKSAGEVGLIQSANLRGENKNWTDSQFLQQAEISLYTNKALNKRAEKVSDIEFLVVNKKGEEIITQESKNLLELLENPNREQTKNEFFALYQKYKDTTGSVYIYLSSGDGTLSGTGKVKEMFLLRPDLVERKFDENGNVVKYIFNKPNGGQNDYNPDEIIASYYFDPLNPLKGASLLRAGSKAISTENQLSDYQENILRNGGRIDGIMSFDSDNLTKVQIEDAKKSWVEQYADAKRVGNPLFMGGKAKFQSLMTTPTELAYLESKGMTLNDICILTEVPKIMLATVDGVKFDNAQESRRMFLGDVIAPLQRNLVKKLSSSLKLTKGLIIGYKDPTPENIEVKLKINDNGMKNFYITQNEARANIGLGPMKGGDEILLPFGMSKAEPETEDQKKKIKALNYKNPLEDKSLRKSYGKLKVAREKENEKIFIKYLDRFFKAQSERLINNIQPANSKVFRKKSLLDETFNINQEIKLTATEFLPLLTKFLQDAGSDTYTVLGNERYKFILSAEIASWLDKKANVFAEQITNTTFERLKEEFTESLELQETRPQLIKRIQASYLDGGAVITKGRANLIARTEVGGAMTKGTFEAYNQAEVPNKIWVTVGDKNVRHSHAEQDGQKKALNDPFQNGLQYPREAGQKASEVVGCRCQI